LRPGRTNITNASDGVHEAAEANAAENLRFAISDHQETIRGADLKAEVLGFLISGVLTVATIEGQASTADLNGWVGIVAIIAALAALVFIGLALWPRTDPWPPVRLGTYAPSRVLYPPVNANSQRDVASAAAAAIRTPWVAELTFELAKLSGIRALKQRWFRWALTASGVAIFAVAVRLFTPAAAVP